MKKKKKYSPHLSIKRLRDLAVKFPKKGTESVLTNMLLIGRFITFVEESRPSLKSKASDK